MIPWQLLDSAQVPGDGGELRLYRRGDEFSIRVKDFELMNSREHHSEEALAELACEKIAANRRPRILIGGLGMGYTLAAALRHLDREAELVVAELVPAVVTWNRGPLAHLAGSPLADERVTVREANVARLLREKGQTYDAIILDVDNGPEGLTRRDNDRLYNADGLAIAWLALRPMGVLAIWSASSDHAFAKRLEKIGFTVAEVRARSRGSEGGGHHTIWLASRGE